MKILIAILIIASLFSAMFRPDEHKTHIVSSSDNVYSSSFIREVFYNYITCVSSSFDILKDNVPVFAQISNYSFDKKSEEILSNRKLIKHTVTLGENLDDIIKYYNPNMDDLDINDFRKVVKYKNSSKISDDYKIQAGEILIIPSEI